LRSAMWPTFGATPLPGRNLFPSAKNRFEGFFPLVSPLFSPLHLLSAPVLRGFFSLLHVGPFHSLPIVRGEDHRRRVFPRLLGSFFFFTCWRYLQLSRNDSAHPPPPPPLRFFSDNFFPASLSQFSTEELNFPFPPPSRSLEAPPIICNVIDRALYFLSAMNFLS